MRMEFKSLFKHFSCPRLGTFHYRREVAGANNTSNPNSRQVCRLIAFNVTNLESFALESHRQSYNTNLNKQPMQ